MTRCPSFDVALHDFAAFYATFAELARSPLFVLMFPTPMKMRAVALQHRASIERSVPADHPQRIGAVQAINAFIAALEQRGGRD